MYINFIHQWRELQFKVDSGQQIFDTFFRAILFTHRIFAWNLLIFRLIRANTLSIRLDKAAFSTRFLRPFCMLTLPSMEK